MVAGTDEDIPAGRNEFHLARSYDRCPMPTRLDDHSSAQEFTWLISASNQLF